MARPRPRPDLARPRPRPVLARPRPRPRPVLSRPRPRPVLARPRPRPRPEKLLHLIRPNYNYNHCTIYSGKGGYSAQKGIIGILDQLIVSDRPSSVAYILYKEVIFLKKRR